MGLKVLITLDLQNATDKQRDAFYSILKKENWNKLSTLTTTWKASFKDEVTRISAIRIIKQDLIAAKSHSGINRVDFAFQLDTKDIIIDKL